MKTLDFKVIMFQIIKMEIGIYILASDEIEEINSKFESLG